MEVVVRCGSCGKENVEGAKFCVECGRAFRSSRRCARCGFENPSHAAYCGECGAGLPTIEYGLPSPWDGRTGGTTTKKRCPSCGGQMDLFDVSCPMCGYSDSMGNARWSVPRSTSKPTVGGVLLILGGILAVFYGILIVAISDTYFNVGGYIACCGLLEVLFGIISVFGGMYAMQREHHTAVLVAAVLCFISGGMFGISSVMGLVALILIAMSGDEFG